MIEKELETYKICVEFPFNSDRKRMSLIIKDTGTYFIFTKGADSVMLPRINFAYESDKGL